VTVFAHCPDREAHCSPKLFEMLPNFVHGDATFFGGVSAQVQRRVDLLAEDSFDCFRQRFAQFQTESHGIC
jgi:hypothetical protein